MDNTLSHLKKEDRLEYSFLRRRSNMTSTPYKQQEQRTLLDKIKSGGFCKVN